MNMRGLRQKGFQRCQKESNPPHDIRQRIGQAVSAPGRWSARSASRPAPRKNRRCRPLRCPAIPGRRTNRWTAVSRWFPKRRSRRKGCPDRQRRNRRFRLARRSLKDCRRRRYRNSPRRHSCRALPQAGNRSSRRRPRCRACPNCRCYRELARESPWFSARPTAHSAYRALPGCRCRRRAMRFPMYPAMRFARKSFLLP